MNLTTLVDSSARYAPALYPNDDVISMAVEKMCSGMPVDLFLKGSA
ncbi:hypothetical protein J7E49_06770 [Variovorax paradoxus]|nr:hypothetical protein [Variovorax paradoxus]